MGSGEPSARGARPDRQRSEPGVVRLRRPRAADLVDGRRHAYGLRQRRYQAVQSYGLRATAKPSEVSSDGSTSSLSQTPAGGGLLPVVAGKQTVRVNFQPSYEPIPSGCIADKAVAGPAHE